MFVLSLLGSARVQVRIRHTSWAADTIPGEAGGDFSAAALVRPDVDDPADAPAMIDDD